MIVSAGRGGCDGARQCTQLLIRHGRDAFACRQRIHTLGLQFVDAPVSAGARGFNRGLIYARDGKLVASVVQEGLMRPVKKKPKPPA